MSKVTIFHNPRCSKSRETLALLESKGIEPIIRLYLETPPSKTEIKQILKLLKLDARALLRTKENEYTQLKLDNPKLSKEALIDAMLQHPKLIERPIVLANKRAAIGRPPENVLEIL